MTAEVSTARRLRGGRRLSTGHTLYWWAEIIAILVYYAVYSAIRNIHGGGNHAPPHAFDHARQIMSLEHHLGIFHEATLQSWAPRAVIIVSNYFYGSLHFIVTIFAGVFLYRRYADDYPRFRNTLAIATGLALIGFALYPLAPPRMFPQLGFVDTLAKDPTFWSFNSGGMQNVSNQFAAMPSVHIAWAGFCALALAPRLKRPALKVLAAVYPLITLTVIVVTANHYILDAVGGAVVLTIGWIIAGRITRAGRVIEDPVS
ncbi:MAG TPA: phosphatase PAP2 family protein [Acidimicrobiia bacterium]|nr:phosphatase PAP2 family protein [Acidimicrobiia bacterium]